MKIFLLTLIAIPILILTLLGVAGHLPGGDGVVCQQILPDGTLLLVTQTYNSGDCGYEVGFYFKSPHSEWGWCYLDHEGSEWRNGRIDYDEATGVATIWKGSTMRGRLNLQSNKWERPDVAGWSSIAPEGLKKPPYGLFINPL